MKKKKTLACSLAYLCREISTCSRKTRKVTFLSSVATSVPSLVKSWRPLGAWLGHFCRLGLYLSSVVSVQLFDKALRYLPFGSTRHGRADRKVWEQEHKHMQQIVKGEGPEGRQGGYIRNCYFLLLQDSTLKVQCVKRANFSVFSSLSCFFKRGQDCSLQLGARPWLLYVYSDIYENCS